MGRMVKRLSGLEIDEISLVDRPANQHGRVVISKNDQEEDMPDLFDADDNPVDENELQVGDFVYDEAGNEYQVQEDVEDDGDQYEDDPRDGADQNEYESVGKSSLNPVQAFKNAKRFGVGQTAQAYGNRGRKYGVQAKEAVVRNRKPLLIGGTAGAAGGYGAAQVGKSAGQRFLDEISKAVSDEDRDQLISKVFDEYEEISKRNGVLEDVVVRLIDEREHEQYTEVAKGYGLGDVDELGGLLQRAANTMDPRDVELIDRLLVGAGEMSKALYAEQGVGGYGDSDVLAQVYAIAGEGVAKSDLGLTPEQAVTAIFDNNPDAYDQYLAETAPYER